VLLGHHQALNENIKKKLLTVHLLPLVYST